MKKIIYIVCLLGGSVSGVCEDAFILPTMDARPIYLWINSEVRQYGDNPEDISPIGTDVEFIFPSSEMEGYRFNDRIWSKWVKQPELADIAMLGSDGKAIGRCDVKYSGLSTSKRGDDTGCSLSFDDVPASGIEWLRIKGKLSVEKILERKTTEPITIRLERGAQAEIEHFSIHLDEKENCPSGSGVYIFSFKIETKRDNVRPCRFVFKDKNNRVLAEEDDDLYHLDEVDGVISFGGNFWAKDSYDFLNEYEEINISVVYDRVEEGYVKPLDLRVDLCAPEQ